MKTRPFSFGRGTVPEKETWWERLPLARDKPWLGLFGAVALMAVALLLRFMLLPVVPAGLPFALFYPAIVASAVLFGIRAGALAGVMGILLAWYFFLPGVGFALGVGVHFALALYTAVIVSSLALIRFLQLALKRANTAREASRKMAESRETLFRELQHRVGNNLQVVSALLSLQKRKLTDPAAIAALEEAADRVQLIGQIQRQLYDLEGQQQAMDDLLLLVVEDCLESFARDDVRYAISVAPGLVMRPDQAIPVALIVYEAVANAVEHGFPDRGGLVSVEARFAGDWIEVCVTDDGAGLPKGFNFSQAQSMGLKLSSALAGQCRGTFALDCAEGVTRATVRLPGAV